MCKDNDDLSKNNNVSDNNNGVNGNNGVGSNDSNDVRTSFTGKELEDALLGFEKEFSEEQNRDSIDDAVKKIEQADFEEDLQGLLGKKGKVRAVLNSYRARRASCIFLQNGWS